MAEPDRTDTGEEPRTILVVDDDPLVAVALVDTLRGSGYNPHVAESAAEAKLLLPLVRPDLIILDLGLPDGDGLLLCAELKEIVDVPIIVCSGTQQRPRDASLSLRLGADDFIGKPFEVHELRARVAAALRRAETRSVAPAPDTAATAEP